MITATYMQDDNEWAVTVAGDGQTLHATAPGIIAARDRAEQLVEKLASEESRPTVVHLLDGSALQFTSTYIAARLARSDVPLASEFDEESAANRQETENYAVPDEPVHSSATDNPEDQDSLEHSRDHQEPQVPEQSRPIPRKKLDKAPESAGKEEHREENSAEVAPTEAEYAGTTASRATEETDDLV